MWPFWQEGFGLLSPVWSPEQMPPTASQPHPLTGQGTRLRADSGSSWEFMIKLFAHAGLAQRHKMSKLKSPSHRLAPPCLCLRNDIMSPPRSSKSKPRVVLDLPLLSPLCTESETPLILPPADRSSLWPHRHSPLRP